MRQDHIPAVFIRGGTSKALVFRRDDLPDDPGDWDRIFLAATGSPDPGGRQLDGMGGGISSLSKVCVVGRPVSAGAEIDYTFAQVGIGNAAVDYSADCGNMSSAIGPFAVDEGLVPAPKDGEAAVRIRNTKTGKIIVARFRASEGHAATESDLTIDGVPGAGAPIRLEFLDPGGAKTGRLLPTGRSVDRLKAPGFRPIEATLVDAANPRAFVAAAELDATGAESSERLEADPVFLGRMEALRRATSVAMKIASDLDEAGRIPSIRKIAVVCAPRAMSTLSGREIQPDEMALGVRMISMGRPHRALPVTGAICLAVAARIEGTIPQRLARAGAGPIALGHPSGTLVVEAEVETAGDPLRARARHGALYRTQRRLFEGHVLVPRRRREVLVREAAE